MIHVILLLGYDLSADYLLSVKCLNKMWLPTCWKTMVPSCRAVFASALSLVFPQALHFSFSMVFPPDLGWQQPPFQQRWSTAGPERGSVKNQRSPALKGYHKLPLWVLMGCHSPQTWVQHKHLFFSSCSNDLVPDRAEPTATLLLGVCSVWHPSFIPTQEQFGLNNVRFCGWRSDLCTFRISVDLN